MGDNNNSNDDVAWMVDFVAGWCSGAAAVIACQPVDTVLTRLQATKYAFAPPPLNNTNTFTSSSLASHAHRTPSVPTNSAAVAAAATQQVRGLVTTAGVSSLWRGSAAMVGAVPFQNALLMAGYGAGKRWSENQNHNNNDNEKRSALGGVFIGGCTGGVVQSFLMSPVELIKVTQQMNGIGVGTAATSLLSRSIAWRGLTATLLRDGMPHGVWFVSYEVMKDELERRCSLETDQDQPAETQTTTSIAIPLFSGAFAATVAWGVGYPFDLIKTRIQAANNGNNGSVRSMGIYRTALELVHESGGRVITGLYRGFGLKLLRAVPASAIGFVVYEAVKKELIM